MIVRRLVMLVLCLMAAVPTVAEPVSVGDLTIVSPWSRATAPRARAGAAFMTITNSGSVDDRLIAAASPVSGITELHTHTMVDGIMRMREVSAIELPAGGEAALQPGGLHVMFMGLEQTLVAGEMFPLKLTFENAGSVDVTVVVGPIGAMGPGAHGGGHPSGHHGGMDHSNMHDAGMHHGAN